MKWIKNHAEKGKAACRLLGNVWVVGGILASLTSFLSEELSVFVLQGLVWVSAILLIGKVAYETKKKRHQSDNVEEDTY